MIIVKSAGGGGVGGLAGGAGGYGDLICVNVLLPVDDISVSICFK